MTDAPDRPLFSGLRITSLATLASRILGMLRDVATAGLFGLAAGGVLDSFVVAFRIPNLFRRMFGEGALTASYIPVLARRLEADRQSAWQLASVVLLLLSAVLAGVVVVAELGCLLIYLAWGADAEVSLIVGLTSAMLPYTLLICVTAQLAATLHALGHFTMPAVAPMVLNIFWLAAVWWIAPAIAATKEAAAYLIAGSIVVAGFAQAAIQVPPLLRHGFRLDFAWRETRDDVAMILRSMAPMMLGLAVTQINSVIDALIAWGLAVPPESVASITWLPGDVSYPLEQGAAGAMYLGDRVAQFPLGILGVAVATVVFPLLSRHAARGDFKQLGEDLTLGLRLVLLWALPASAGLVILAHPIARLLFEHGAFTSRDAARTGTMIACYGAGVWAYCGLPILVRGYYAASDHVTPTRIGAAMVALNIGLGLILVWPLAEAGLAIATAVSAVVQLVLLARLIGKRSIILDYRPLGRSLRAAIAGTLAMSVACFAAAEIVSDGETAWQHFVSVGLPVVVSLAVYPLCIRAIDPEQWRLMCGRV